MIRKVIREQTPFEKYFSEAPARKPYMKIVSAFPDGRLKGFDSNILSDEDDDLEEDLSNIELDDDDLVDDTDFSDNIIDDEDLVDGEPDVSSEPVSDDKLGEVTAEPPAVSAGEEPEVSATSGGGGLDVEPPSNEDFGATDDTSGNDGGENIETPPPVADDAQTVPSGDDVGGEVVDEPPDGDDFSANIDDTDASDDSMSDESENSEGTDGQKGPTNTIDNQLRFSLYRNMKNLYKAIQSYEERLDELVSPSYNFNITSKIANKKLVELEETMYQYMTVKFKDADYIISMNFYQKCIAALMLIFELLKNNKEDLNDDKNDKLKGKTFI